MRKKFGALFLSAVMATTSVISVSGADFSSGLGETVLEIPFSEELLQESAEDLMGEIPEYSDNSGEEVGSVQNREIEEQVFSDGDDTMQIIPDDAENKEPEVISDENESFLRLPAGKTAEEMFAGKELPVLSGWTRTTTELYPDNEGNICAKVVPVHTGRYLISDEVECFDSDYEEYRKWYGSSLYMIEGNTYYLYFPYERTATEAWLDYYDWDFMDCEIGSADRRVLYREVDVKTDSNSPLGYACDIPGELANITYWHCEDDRGAVGTGYIPPGYVPNGDILEYRLAGMDANRTPGTYAVQAILTNGRTGEKKILDDLGTVEVKDITELPLLEKSGTIDTVVDTQGYGWFRFKTGEDSRYSFSSLDGGEWAIYVSTWNGSELIPSDIHITGDDTILSPNTVYYIRAYHCNKVTVEAKGTAGTIPLSDCTVNISDAVAYTGEAVIPSIEVKYGTTILAEGTDYTITLSNNTELGNSASVTLTGKGTYTGTVTKTFKIQLAAPKLSSAKSAGFNAVTVSWKKVTGARTYNLYYKGGTVTSWKLAKSGITATSYKHKTSNLLTGTKYTYTVRAVSGSNISGYDKTGVSAAPALNKAKLTKLAPVSKGIQLTWAKVPGSSGYVIQRQDNGKWGTIKTIAKGTTVTYTDTAAKAGSQNSYRIRAYRTVNGTKVYGAYSAAKSAAAQGLMVSGVVTDSASGKGLSGVSLSFRKGKDKKTGSVYAQAKSGGSGSYSVALEEGPYTVQLSMSGYVTTYVNIECKKAANGSADRVDLSISRQVKEDQYRIVLSWGKNPEDLDAHLTGPLSDGSRFHVFYHTLTAYENNRQIAKVDVDDKTSYGPETVTVTVDADSSEVYRYYVHNYTNRASKNSSVLANSGARVTVYKGGRQVASYDVPKQAGTKWHVFNIWNGKVLPINKVTYESNAGNFQ